MSTTTEIPRDIWTQFFVRFSRDHEMEFVTLEVMGGEIGAQVEGRALLFSGISADNENIESVDILLDTLDS